MLQLNMAPVISAFASSYTVRRKAAPTWTDGFQTEGVDTSRTVTAMIRPATSADTQLLPEGRRNVGARTVHSVDEIFVGDVSTGQPADRFVIDSEEWELVQLDTWNPQGQYWRGLLQRVGR